MAKERSFPRIYTIKEVREKRGAPVGQTKELMKLPVILVRPRVSSPCKAPPVFDNFIPFTFLVKLNL